MHNSTWYWTPLSHKGKILLTLFCRKVNRSSGNSGNVSKQISAPTTRGVSINSRFKGQPLSRRKSGQRSPTDRNAASCQKPDLSLIGHVFTQHALHARYCSDAGGITKSLVFWSLLQVRVKWGKSSTGMWTEKHGEVRNLLTNAEVESMHREKSRQSQNYKETETMKSRRYAVAETSLTREKRRTSHFHSYILFFLSLIPNGILIFISLSVQPKIRPCISGSVSSLSFPQWWVQKLRSKPNWTWHSPRHRDRLRNEPVTPTGCKGARRWERVEKKFSHFQKRVYKRDAFLPVDAGCLDVTPRTVTTRVASLTVR